MKTPMLNVIEIENQYYVRAKSSLADTRTNVLMAGDIFAVFDRQGNFRTTGSTERDGTGRGSSVQTLLRQRRFNSAVRPPRSSLLQAYW